MLGLGSSSTLGLGIVMTLDDQFSKAAKGVVSALGDVDAVVNSFARIGDFGNGMADFGMAIAKGLGASVKEFAKFEDIMNSVKVIAGDQGLTDSDFQAMSSQVKKLGEMYGILPDFVANAQLELAKAGKKPIEIMAMTEATMALGAATDTVVSGANGAAEILVNVMQAFNATAKEADKYAAALTSAANQSTIDVKDFYQSIRYSADIASSLGISIDEVSASIATLGNAGLKGSIAGTSYANMLRYLTKAMGKYGTKNQKDALATLGIAKSDLIDESTGSLKSMAEILAVVRESYLRMPDAITRFNATNALFGVRGDRAAQPLIQGIMETNGGLVTAFEEMSRRINDDIANNIHLVQAEKRLDDLMGDYGKFTAALANLKIAIGSGLAPMLRPLLQRLSSGMRALTEFFESDFGKTVSRLAGLSTVWMIVIGKLIAAGARFYTWMITSAGQLKAAFTVGTVTAKELNTAMVTGSQVFLRNVMLAANKWTIASKAGMVNSATGTIMTRGAGGRFAGSMKANWMTALFGLFGRRGLRVYLTFTQWLTKALPWVSKLAFGFGGLGKVIGLVFRGLFSWPALIADIALTLTTGKGLFEWIWELLKVFGNAIQGLTDMIPSMTESFSQLWDADKLNAGNFLSNIGQTNPLLNWWEGKLAGWSSNMKNKTSSENINNLPNQIGTSPISTPHQERRIELDKMNRTINDAQKQQIQKQLGGSGKGGSTQINLTINNNTEGQTKKKIILDQERSLQSYAIN